MKNAAIPIVALNAWLLKPGVQLLLITILCFQMIACEKSIKNKITDNDNSCIVDAKLLVLPDTVVCGLNNVELIIIVNTKLKEWIDYHKCSYRLYWPPLDSSRFINVFNNSAVISQSRAMYRISVPTNLFVDSTERYVSRINSKGFASATLMIINNETNEKVSIFPCQ